MKKITVLISVILFLSLVCISCGKNSGDTDNDSQIVSEQTDNSSQSDTETASSEPHEKSEQDSNDFPYIDYPYTVTAENERDSIEYKYTFYLDDYTVKGITLLTTFKSEDDAETYLKSVSKKYENAFIHGRGVIIYFEEDEHHFYGFTEKELFAALSEKIYKITVTGRPVPEESSSESK